MIETKKSIKLTNSIQMRSRKRKKKSTFGSVSKWKIKGTKSLSQSTVQLRAQLRLRITTRALEARQQSAKISCLRAHQRNES